MRRSRSSRTPTEIEGRMRMCSVTIFAHEVGYEEFEFPNYCSRVLFISSTEITHPEKLPEGVA